MITTDLSQMAVEPLINLAMLLIQQRSESGWKAARVESVYKFGMMLTTLRITSKSGRNELVEIPTEYCEKFNSFRVEYSKKTDSSVSEIILEVTSKGVYDLKFKA